MTISVLVAALLLSALIACLVTLASRYSLKSLWSAVALTVALLAASTYREYGNIDLFKFGCGRPCGGVLITHAVVVGGAVVAAAVLLSVWRGGSARTRVLAATAICLPILGLGMGIIIE